MIWTVNLCFYDVDSPDDFTSFDETIEAASLEDAEKAAEQLARKCISENFADDDFREIVREDDGSDEYYVQAPFVTRIEARWEVVPGGRDGAGGEVSEDRTPMAEDTVTVTFEVNHEALIRAAGGDPDCQHEWDEDDPRCGYNNALLSEDRCLLCGLEKSMATYSHAPAMDTVCYKQPKYWCPKCQSDQAPCGCEEEEEDEEEDAE